MLYRRTQFSQYDVKESDHYLLQAAQLEHATAQLMLGKHLWRSRKRYSDADIQACYWFSRSAQHGNDEARTWLQKLHNLTQSRRKITGENLHKPLFNGAQKWMISRCWYNASKLHINLI